jgi:hypothetical protein
MPGAGIGPRTHRHDSASLCQSKETEDHKYMMKTDSKENRRPDDNTWFKRGKGVG